MSFQALYDSVQQLKGRVSSKWLRDEAIGLSNITKVKEQWTSVLDDAFIRGFYIEGPKGPPVALQEGEALIVLARKLTKDMRRFVYTKELMHVFDKDEEKADTPEKFDMQAERFRDPTVDSSPQFRAETKAFWRALAVLCPENQRLTYKSQILASQVSLEVVAAAQQIPPVYARNWFREDFEAIVAHIMN